MAITVSRPGAGRLTVQKITDYRLSLACHRDLAPVDSLTGQPIVGYIPDMIFDRELDYLGEIGVEAVQMASNSVVVQLQMLRARAGIGIVHDFALPFAPDLVRVLPDRVAMTRTFHLVRHQADRRSDRLNRLARLICDGLRAEVARLEAAAA